MKVLSDNPNVFARNLMRVTFSEDELLGKSLFGKTCHVNKTSVPLPALDPERRDAIISKY